MIIFSRVSNSGRQTWQRSHPRRLCLLVFTTGEQTTPITWVLLVQVILASDWLTLQVLSSDWQELLSWIRGSLTKHSRFTETSSTMTGDKWCSWLWVMTISGSRWFYTHFQRFKRLCLGSSVTARGCEIWSWLQQCSRGWERSCWFWSVCPRLQSSQHLHLRHIWSLGLTASWWRGDRCQGNSWEAADWRRWNISDVRHARLDVHWYKIQYYRSS